MVNHIEGLADPVNLIVISGDIYNHRQIQQETESARLAFNTVRRLSEYAPVIILTGTPSHDGKAPLMLDDIGNGGYPNPTRPRRPSGYDGISSTGSNAQAQGPKKVYRI
jgi:hypothetical protein